MTTSNEQSEYSLIQKLCIHLVKYGSIPKHVAIIMDGNRRFARQNKLEPTDGHVKGSTKLSQVLRWCNDLGIEELTVYAFSVENFNRTPSEIAFLFDLIEDKLKELLAKKDELCTNGVCVRIIGNLVMLPTRIQRASCELMLQTRHNTKATLNVCLAYGSSDELTESMDRLRLGVENGLIKPGDIDKDLLTNALYTRLSRPLDLFLRTSGEVRLSDFLLWQATHHGSVHAFVTHNWPELTLWHFLQAIFHYQLSRAHLSHLASNETIPESLEEIEQLQQRTMRVQRFLVHLDQSYWDDVTKRAQLSSPDYTPETARQLQRPVGEFLSA